MKLRMLKLGLCGIAVAGAIACIVMPVMGARGVFAEFHEPYSAGEHFKLLAEQSAGPVYTLLVVVVLAVLLMRGQRIPWEAWLLALAGPLYTAITAGMVAHDFSHVVFQECSEIYGQWLDRINIAAGVSLATLARVAIKTEDAPGKIERDSAGGVILRLVIPAGAVLLGIGGIAEGWYLRTYTSMLGTPPMVYGAAFVALGVATFGLPAWGARRNATQRRAGKVRLYGGLALSAMLLIGAFVRWT